MEMKVIRKRDVIVCRGIWYVMTLLSLFGLSISLNLLWPPGDHKSSDRFLRDGAVSVTTFYGVTLLRNLLFNDPLDPSTCYKVFTKRDERFPQIWLSEFSVVAVFLTTLFFMKEKAFFLWYKMLFVESLVTGGIGLIQLSDKLRMEMNHSFLTLFFCWLCGFSGVFIDLQAHANAPWFLCGLYLFLHVGIVIYNFPDVFFGDNTSPLPT